MYCDDAWRQAIRMDGVSVADDADNCPVAYPRSFGSVPRLRS